MLAVALVAFAANVASVFLLRRHDEDDVNVKSAFLHMAQDALASLAVVVAALLAKTAVGPWVDPAAAILVGVVVLRSAVSLVWETVSTLLEGAPAGVDVEELAASVATGLRRGAAAPRPRLAGRPGPAPPHGARHGRCRGEREGRPGAARGDQGVPPREMGREPRDPRARGDGVRGERPSRQLE